MRGGLRANIQFTSDLVKWISANTKKSGVLPVASVFT
jgi:hypothetical protein